MSYVSETLHPDEVVEFETRLSGIIYVFPWLLIATILTGPFGIIGVPLGILFLILQMIGKATSEFAVTSHRVIMKTGWLYRKTIELNISKVESVDIHQGVFGQMFDYGTVTVVGTGASKQPFRTVANPIPFRKAIQAVQLRDQASQANHAVNNTTQIAVFVSTKDFPEGGAPYWRDGANLGDVQRLLAQSVPQAGMAPIAGVVADGGKTPANRSAGESTYADNAGASSFDDIKPWEPRSFAQWWRDLSGVGKITVLSGLGALLLFLTTHGSDDASSSPEPTVEYQDADRNAVPAPSAAPAQPAKSRAEQKSKAVGATSPSDWVGHYDATFDGATGGIDISRAADGKLFIAIGVAGRSCAGGIDAIIDQPDGNIITVAKAPYVDREDQESACRISVRKRGDELSISEDEVCMNHHGMSCGFDGTARRSR